MSIETSYTIMTGMDCGTPSFGAWPDLKQAVDAAVTVFDYESHEALEYMAKCGVNAGPCGGAALAALRRLKEDESAGHLLTSESVVLLLSTEGAREYKAPPLHQNDDEDTT